MPAVESPDHLEHLYRPACSRWFRNRSGCWRNFFKLLTVIGLVSIIRDLLESEDSNSVRGNFLSKMNDIGTVVWRRSLVNSSRDTDLIKSPD